MKSTDMRILILLATMAVLSCSSKKSTEQEQSQRPNIIYILADDLGYGDLSCYGQQNFATPNIDKLAEEGIRFTQHYSGSTVCAPSRSSLMTGLHTGHTPIRGNKEWKPEGQWPMPAKTYTMAEMLKDAGYVTGAFGKWGLGYPGSEGDPNHQGFDEFYGYNCQRIAHHYYPFHMWHNQEKVMLEGNEGTGRGTYGPDPTHQMALKFLEENKDREFFMFYPSAIPHAEFSGKSIQGSR
jgi:arylsulfatase A-like enzyme